MNRHKNLIFTLVMAAIILAPLALIATPAIASPPQGNTIAICGCGAVFVPDENTKYITHDGVQFACCGEGCHKMAVKEPAKAAEMARAGMAKAVKKVHIPVQVANVIEVTKEGAVALCGCGHKSSVNSETFYLESGDKTYAACSQGCRDNMAKDAAKAVVQIEAKLAEHQHEH